MRRHLGTALTTIQKIQKSMYERIFRETIRHLEEFSKELESLDGFTQNLPSILSALTELNHTHVTNDTVVNTLMSLLVLFGKKDTDITVIYLLLYFQTYRSSCNCTYYLRCVPMSLTDKFENTIEDKLP